MKYVFNIYFIQKRYFFSVALKKKQKIFFLVTKICYFQIFQIFFTKNKNEKAKLVTLNRIKRILRNNFIVNQNFQKFFKIKLF